jgi:hypothetical protein
MADHEEFMARQQPVSQDAAERKRVLAAAYRDIHDGQIVLSCGETEKRLAEYPTSHEYRLLQAVKRLW